MKAGQYGGMRLMHDFHKSLAKSHRYEHLLCWGEIYRKGFSDMVKFETNRKNTDLQRKGVDRTIFLSTGKQILVDEKARERPYQGDILLEYISNDVTRSPGWVCKPLLCDYIAVAYVPSGHAFLLPVIQLQEAWKIHGAKWIDAYHINPAKNKRYKTWNVAVPTDELFRAIGSRLRIDFTPADVNDPSAYGDLDREFAASAQAGLTLDQQLSHGRKKKKLKVPDGQLDLFDLEQDALAALWEVNFNNSFVDDEFMAS